ncbi:MAG: PadR family transcriptional regulator [Kineosporiaceae bacterium]|nr:PadR family transcriptional regulator [Aeromicrobium sp.]
MALEHAILVSLAEKSASGYDLARRFDKSIGHFWKASHQQIYKVLARMEGEKWVEAHLVEQTGRPDKKDYAITGEGRDELRRWTTEATPPEALRSEFAVKVRGMRFGDRDAVVDGIRNRRDEHRSKLDYYLADSAKNFSEPTSLPAELAGAYLVLRGGIRAEQTGLEWCEEMLNYLDSAARSDR